MGKFEAPHIQVEILQALPKEAQEYIVALQTYLQTIQAQLLNSKFNLTRIPKIAVSHLQLIRLLSGHLKSLKRNLPSQKVVRSVILAISEN